MNKSTHKSFSRIVSGQVMHKRHSPAKHRFIHKVFFLLLDIDDLDKLSSSVFGINQFRLVSFHFKDHGDTQNPRIWLSKLLHSHGLPEQPKRVIVQTFPRVLGYLFNPVSFWYCIDQQDNIYAIVAEVNNTFAERYYYVVRPDAENSSFSSIKIQKAFYVSPFLPANKGSYQFSFATDLERPTVNINYSQQSKRMLTTAITGTAQHFTPTNLIKAVLQQPFLTFGVTLKIHWHAVILWLKRVPLFANPGMTGSK